MLYNNQHFNIDLVDVPVVEAADDVKEKVVQPVYDEETDEKPCDLVSNPILKEFLDNIPFGYLTSFEHVLVCIFGLFVGNARSSFSKCCMY